MDKDDDLNKVVGQLTAVEAEKIILNIPKNSVLGSSVHNFQILERECETAGKELAIESVDERILELASLATIPAINPVFKTRERSVVDILPGLDDVGATEIELVRQSEVPNAERGGKEKIEGRKPARKSGVKKAESREKEKSPGNRRNQNSDYGARRVGRGIGEIHSGSDSGRKNRKEFRKD